MFDNLPYKFVLADSSTPDQIDIQIKKLVSALNDSVVNSIEKDERLRVNPLLNCNLDYSLFLTLAPENKQVFIVLCALADYKSSSNRFNDYFDLSLTNERSEGRQKILRRIGFENELFVVIHFQVPSLANKASALILSRLEKNDFSDYNAHDRAYLVNSDASFKNIFNTLHFLDWDQENSSSLIRGIIDGLKIKLDQNTSFNIYIDFLKALGVFIEENSIDNRVIYFLDEFTGLENEFPFNKNGLYKTKVFAAAKKYYYKNGLTALDQVKIKRRHSSIIDYCKLNIKAIESRINSDPKANLLYEGNIKRLSNDYNFWGNAEMCAQLELKEVFEETVEELSFLKEHKIISTDLNTEELLALYTFIWKCGAIKQNEFTRANLKKFIAQNFSSSGKKGKMIQLSGLETRIKDDLQEHSVLKVIELLENSLFEIKEFESKAQLKLSTVISTGA